MYDFYSKNASFKLSPESISDYSHVILNEIDSLKGDEADLSSFKIHCQLNPSIWNGKKIKSDIRLKLLEIADDFTDFLNLRWAKPVDIILTGSLANYNWSDYSDFDLHVVYHYDDIDERTDFVKDFLTSKKNEWNEEYGDIELLGFPVELYAQNADECHSSTGVYSLESNKWLKEPIEDELESIKLNKYYIKEKALSYISKIDKLCNSFNSSDDLDELTEKVKKMLSTLKHKRGASLLKSGEMSSFNIIYKFLRRTGYLDKLYSLKTKIYVKKHSI